MYVLLLIFYITINPPFDLILISVTDEASPDDVAEQNIITGDEAELVLPSGAVIGHRSLRRYYKLVQAPL